MPDWRLRLSAGEHCRVDCPVKVNVGPVGGKPRSLKLTEAATGRSVPCQGGVDDEGNLWVHWVLDVLAAGSTREYLLETRDEEEAHRGVIVEDQDGRVRVQIGGHLFTAYNYSDQWARPFLWPVVGPYGDNVTRNYPMVQDIEGEKHDHPHHKSIYTAHGDVNGVDNWSETPGHGRILHRGFRQLVSGPVLGVIQADNDWVSNQGEKVMYEQRTMVFYNLLPNHEKIIDYTVHFKADMGPVKFGDTKEGGILSVRVATSMDVNSGMGGKIENAYGGTNEKETWGKKAQWCDYSGPVMDRWVGIAIMDHIDNVRYPSEYHVRNYGLMTANPFAWHDYKADASLDGSLYLEAGKDLVFRYRLLIHRGDAQLGNVAARYHDFINPPTVEVI
ncbi:MAG: PmoA family protein [Anaerolineae bacterium]|jgi:hypothetical protein